MRFAAATTVLAGAGLLGGHAFAETIPIPTVPTITIPGLPVTVPAPTTTTVPLPTTPTLPTPALPTASPVPVATSTPTGGALQGVPASSSVGGSTPGGGGSAGSPSSASAAPGSDRPRVERLRSSRTWIATSGPKGRRVTTLTFVLPRAARVVFVVQQLAPVCRIAWHFAVNGHAGRNRIRFPGRGSKLQLDPGTYRITARTRAGQVVQRVTIVVVEGGAPTRDQIFAARVANVCSLAAAGGSTGASNASNLSSSPQEVQRSFTPGQPSASGPSEAVLASTVRSAARAVRPVLVALLALAILLLAVASLPRPAFASSRANDLLARHRLEIAALGTAAFVAVVIALLLG